MEHDLDALERTLGVAFCDRSLFFQALVHRSYLNENPESQLTSNERLEFLGDAVLDTLAAEYLFRRHVEKGEGELTLLRSALVREEALAEFAMQLGLGRFLVLGRGEESDGGRSRSAILADAFEAIVGAIYLDTGVEAARTFLLPLLGEAEKALDGRPPLDYKSALQIEIQARLGMTPQYHTVASWGPDHARTFRVEVRAGESVLGIGEGLSKQAAQQEAARAALEKMGKEQG